MTSNEGKSKKKKKLIKKTMAMANQIRVIIESLNDAGDVIDKDIVMTRNVTKPNHSIELGFRHSEQIELLRQIEQKILNMRSSPNVAVKIHISPLY